MPEQLVINVFGVEIGCFLNAQPVFDVARFIKPQTKAARQRKFRDVIQMLPHHSDLDAFGGRLFSHGSQCQVRNAQCQ